MQQKKRESWKMSFIAKLGLNKIIEDNFIYQPPKQQYQIKLREKSVDLAFYISINGELRELSQLTNTQTKVSILKEFQYGKVVSHVPVIHFSCNSDKVIIFSHSNAVDLGDVYRVGIMICEIYLVDVICYDYSGYGLTVNSMKPSEYGISNDLFNVLALAQHQYDYVFLWGFSIGSVPTVKIASEFQISGVILQAPLASLGRVIDNRNSFTSKHDRLENESLIDKISAPVLIFHGMQDTIIKINHSEQLFKKCSNPFCFVKVEGANHNDLGAFISDKNSEVSKSIYTLLYHPKIQKINKVFELSLRFDNLIFENTENSTNKYSNSLPRKQQKKLITQEKQSCSFFCYKY